MYTISFQNLNSVPPPGRSHPTHELSLYAPPPLLMTPAGLQKGRGSAPLTDGLAPGPRGPSSTTGTIRRHAHRSTRATGTSVVRVPKANLRPSGIGAAPHGNAVDGRAHAAHVRALLPFAWDRHFVPSTTTAWPRSCVPLDELALNSSARRARARTRGQMVMSVYCSCPLS